MSNTAPSAGTSSSPPEADRTSASASSQSAQEWPHQATSAIVDLVGTVKAKTVGPATTAARGVVYGLLAAVLGVAAAVLVAVLASRGLILAVDGLLSLGDLDRAGRAVWISELVVGVVAIIVGAVVWRKGLRPPAP